MENSDIPYTERDLIQRAINTAQFMNNEPRWVAVKRVFGTGEEVSRLICYRYGYDPDKIIYGPWGDSQK